MNIKIDDTWVITSDDRNIILNRSYVAKDGKRKGEEILKPESYHGSIEGALDMYSKRMVASSAATSFSELKKCMQEIKETIRSVR